MRCPGADDRSDFSNAPMKMFANEGAILVPMACHVSVSTVDL